MIARQEVGVTPDVSEQGQGDDGVSLMTARKAGAAGREAFRRIYVCADLACSLYVRGKRDLRPGSRFEETLTTGQQIARTVGSLPAFLAKLHD